MRLASAETWWSTAGSTASGTRQSRLTGRDLGRKRLTTWKQQPETTTTPRCTPEKCWEFRQHRHLFIAFIDLKGAFNAVDHASLWNILQMDGVPPKINTLFQLLYGNAESCMQVNGKDSGWFPINSGVRQGYCVIDYLMTKVCNSVPGVSFGNYDYNYDKYVDDTTLLCSSLAWTPSPSPLVWM